MNRTLLIIGVVAVLLIGGFFVWNTYYPITPATTETPAGTDGTPIVDQTPTPTAPLVVTSSNAFPSDTTVVISGSITPNGASTNYWFEYGKTADFGSKTATQNIGSGYTVIPAPIYITGLVKDTTYYYRLVATNALGTTPGTSYSFRTTVGTPAPVGSVPTTKTLAANSVSRTGADINGEVTPNKSATQYWFEYGNTDALGVASPLQSVGEGIAKVPASLSLTGLTPATTYYFRINAQNQFGTVNGAVLTFKTAGPPVAAAPVVTTLITTTIGTTTATLRGTVNPYNVQTTYWFEYGTSINFTSNVTQNTTQKSAGAGGVTVSIQANVSSLTPKTTYYYRTVAQNSAGTVRGAILNFKTN